MGDDEGLELVLGRITRLTGVSFEAYRRTTLRRRLAHRMATRRATTVEAYLAVLEEDEREVIALFDALLIKTTALFRDPVVLDVLRRDALPELVARRAREGAQTVRAWVPACATGEEAFSLAMCLLEATRTHGDLVPEVLASDVDARSLARARSGLVRPDSLGRLPRGFERYLRRREEAYAITSDVLRVVSFCEHDLTSTDRIAPAHATIASFDVISCSNFLIYLTLDGQRLVLDRLVKSVSAGGVLVVGRAERPSDVDRLAPVRSGEPVFRVLP